MAMFTYLEWKSVQSEGDFIGGWILVRLKRKNNWITFDRVRIMNLCHILLLPLSLMLLLGSIHNGNGKSKCNKCDRFKILMLLQKMIFVTVTVKVEDAT